MATKKHQNHSTHHAHAKKNWEATIEDWFTKLPPLSKNAREAIVNITPWIALIFGILGILGTLAGFGILTVFSPFIILSSGLGGATGSIVSAILGFIASILLLAAYPGSKARKAKGWKMLFWSEVVNLFASVFSFSLGGILINLVGFYLLYQIKPYYK